MNRILGITSLVSSAVRTRYQVLLYVMNMCVVGDRDDDLRASVKKKLQASV